MTNNDDSQLSLLSLDTYEKYQNNTSFLFRLKILYKAFLNLFTGKEIFLTSQVKALFSQPEVSLSCWLNLGDGWKSHHVSFDFLSHKSKSYINGVQVSGDKDV